MIDATRWQYKTRVKLLWIGKTFPFCNFKTTAFPESYIYGPAPMYETVVTILIFKFLVLSEY